MAYVPFMSSVYGMCTVCAWPVYGTWSSVYGMCLVCMYVYSVVYGLCAVRVE